MKVKFLVPLFVFVIFCLGSCECENAEDCLSEQKFANALAVLSEQYNVPLSYDSRNSCMSDLCIEEISHGLEAINSMEQHKYEIVMNSSNELSIVCAPLQASSLHPVSEVSSAAIGESSWLCQFTLSWSNGIDVYYSVSTEFWEKYGDNVTCAYINEGRVYLDTRFYLRWAGIEYGAYSLCGYYDIVSQTDTFVFTRVY